MEQYYELKNKYDKKYRTGLNKIYSNIDLSVNEKRKIASRYSPTCINCRKKGGTIFTFEDNIYTVKCGAISKCDLNIVIERKKTKPLATIINEKYSELNNIKEKIYKCKLDYLYKFKSEDDTLEQYNGLKDKFININNNLVTLNEELSDILKINEKNIEIKELTNLYYKLVKDVKQNAINYNDSNDESLLQDNAVLFKDSILSLLNDIRDLKYDSSFIDVVQNKNKIDSYVLNQISESITKTQKILDN